MAPMVPATWLPWPLSSGAVVGAQVPVVQSIEATTFRSGWAVTPVSMTATSVSMRLSSVPSMSTLALVVAKIRCTPVGTTWPLMWSVWSARTAVMAGSVSRRVRSAVVISAA
jgi:hypothetical protein